VPRDHGLHAEVRDVLAGLDAGALKRMEVLLVAGDLEVAGLAVHDEEVLRPPEPRVHRRTEFPPLRCHGYLHGSSF
jgi:hypothetical protein